MKAAESLDRVNTILPLTKLQPVPGTHRQVLVRLSTVWKHGWIGHLLHEQRNVLEHVAVVETETAAQYLGALAGRS